MKKIFLSLISLLLCAVMMSTSVLSVAASTDDQAKILSTEMNTNAQDSNLDEFYYSKEDWAKTYPNGLFVVEYDSYGAFEGGEDRSNPQDVYLGITVYRLGGNNYSDKLTYHLTGISADEELYPDSMGEITFEPQQEKAIAKVRITNDDVRKGDQLIMFSLESAEKGIVSPASSALITITDDEPYVDGEISISTPKAVLDKAQGGAEITVYRGKSTSEYSTLTIFTTDGSAKAGEDYKAVEKKLMFSPGESEKVVTIPFIQSDDKFTDPKSFTVSVKDLKGCVLKGNDSIRVDFTNKIEKEAQKLTEVNAEADFLANNSEALTDSSYSVININDNFDRKSMLSAAVGSANGGKSVKTFASTGMRAAAKQEWKDYVYVNIQDFYALYNNGSSWSPLNSYNDGNQDVMIVSKDKFNLNQFSDVYYSFQNHRVLANGHPNTAVGYMLDNSEHFNSNSFSYTKGSLNANSSLDWMKARNTYVIGNYNCCNIDKTGGVFDDISGYNPAVLGNTLHSDFSYTGGRMPGTSGIDATGMSLFFMLYDDEGWDDHHFTAQYVVLKRDVIPVEIFEGEGVTDFKVDAENKEVSFVKEGYKYVVKANSEAGGMVQCDKSSYGYGFYAGSELKVNFSAVSAIGQSTPVPEYFFLTDSSGVIHTSAKASGSSFIFKLETVMSEDRNALRNQYYMSEKEAEAHANIVRDDKKIISSRLQKEKEPFEPFNLDVTYSLKQSVSLFYKDVPTLTTKATLTNGNRETDAEYMERVLNVLDGVVEFYLNGEEVTPEPVINKINNCLQYPSTDFDYIRVTPSAMGVGAVVTSNLSDIDYTRIVSSTDITNETCRQNSGQVQFNVLDEETTYINPAINFEALSVSMGKDGELETEYIANPLDRMIPFENLYPNTDSENNEISYVTLDFSVSDIYVAGATDCAPKDFVVSAYHEFTTNEREKELLFEYIFTGGRPVSESENVMLYNLNSSFTKNDAIDVPDGVDKEAFKPVVKLLGLTSEGYQYRLFIPTFFSYQGSNAYSPYYDTVFEGKDGIRLEVFEIQSGSKEDFSKITKGNLVCAMGANDMQYIAPQLPVFDTEADEQSGETPYSDVQQNFYTYRENCLLLGSPNLSIDCSNISMFSAKIIKAFFDSEKTDPHRKRLIKTAGSGISVKLGSDSITISGKIAYTPGKLTGSYPFAPYVFSDGTKVTNQKAKSLQIASNSKYLGGSVGFAGEVSIQLNYDTISHKYVFHKVVGSGSVTGSISATIPFTVPMIFACVTTSLTGVISVGYMQVLNYVDQDGVSHYKSLCTGVPMSLTFAISGTIGFGFSGVLAAEIGISFDVSLAATWLTPRFTPIQSELDIGKTSSKPHVYQVAYNGDWDFDNTNAAGGAGNEVYGYENYSYGHSLVSSENGGDSCIIKTRATSIQLTGVVSKSGAVMNVTLENSDTGEIYDKRTINTYSDKTKYGANIYTYDFPDYLNSEAVPVKLTIEHDKKSAAGSHITLDSIRIINPIAYENDTEVITFTNFNFKIAAVLKFTIAFFKINLDPAYMKFNLNEKDYSVTLGTLGYSYTWNYNRKSVRSMEANKEQDIPLLVVNTDVEPSQSGSDYFDLGEYGDNKEKKLLVGDLEITANTQTVYHKGKVYSFFAAITENEQRNYSYNLYCSVDGKEAKVVSESEAFINEFYVFEDNQGKLCVEFIAADTTVSHIAVATDGIPTVYFNEGKAPVTLKESEDMRALLDCMCVKIAVFDEASGTFSNENTTVIAETDGNGRFESIPSVAEGSGKASVVFYVVDQMTDVNADYNINSMSNVPGIKESLDETKELYDTLYSGRSELRYTVLKDGKLSNSASVNTNPTEAELKAGYKITEVSAVMADDNNLCLSYTAEFPYSLLHGQPGTLMELYWQNAQLKGDGTLNFDKRLTISSVMDFDKSIADFEASLAKEDIRQEYYNPDTGEYYSEIILNNISMKLAKINEDGSDSEIQKQPCLFYATNDSINCVTYDKVKKVLAGEKTDVGVLYDNQFKDFIVAVSEDGDINLIYIEQTDTYQDSLYYINYDSEDNSWSKPRRLTYSDVFDEEAYKNYETTSTLSFDSFDAFVNKRGEISITLRSSYIPFIYKYSAESDKTYGDTSVNAFADSDYEYENDEGKTVQGVVFPTLDPSSPLARSDVFSLTFKEPQTVIDVENFVVVNPVFVKGETVDVSFDIVNKGDTTVKQMRIELVYYDISADATNRIKYQDFTGSLLAGDRTKVNMVYDVSDYVGNNVLLGVRIIDGMDVLYHSYNDSYLKAQENENFENITYHEIGDAAEFDFSALRADIDSSGVMSFTAEILNYGTLSAQNEVMLYCKAYDNEDDSKYINTIFAYSIDPSKLEVGEIASVSNQIDVSSYLVNGELSYGFELKAKDKQYTTDNDKRSVSKGYQQPEININSSDFAEEGLRLNGNAHRNTLTFNMMLGDEITMNADVIGSSFDLSQLSVYEVGTDCLSISHNPVDGNIKLKAISLPQGRAGVVKTILHLKNTSVYKYIYIHLSNRDFVEFGDSVTDKGWTVTGQNHVYAVNYNLAQTTQPGSEISFKYYGDNLEIIGDKLTNGGDFEITVTDSTGKVLAQSTVSTKSDLNDFGKVLYKGEGFGFGEYNVKIKAALDEGEMLSLDRADFDVDRSNADVTPYNTVDSYVENLDAPLVDGRQRQASFTLVFSKKIALAEGKKLSDLTLKFKELKGDGKTFEETGEEVVFTACKISGTQLTFIAPLESTPGYIMKYVLANGEIQKDFIVDENGDYADTKIPDYDLVSYILKESGILSVSVCDDENMAIGNIRKSVHVKFMTIPDISRLEGTKLLYTTLDSNGEKQTVEFNFAEITNDPRVAVYRADRLTIDNDELEKTFSFEEGIVLNSENYVLVTAEGDYLDNDITTIYEKSDLDITYSKAKAISTDIRVTVTNSGFKPSVYLTFNEDVNIQGALNNAFIILRETTTKDGVKSERHIELFAESGPENKVLVFRTNETLSASQADTVEYSVISDKIGYRSPSVFIVTNYEKIAVNPYIKADKVSFNTKAYVESITPYTDDAGLICAKVVFTSELTEDNLKNTYVNLLCTTEEYSRVNESNVTLNFESSEITIAGDRKTTTAIYKSADIGEAILDYEEVAKTFTAPDTLGVKGTLTDTNGVAYTTDVLTSDSFKVERAQAQRGEITLVENGDSGYHAELSLSFNENITTEAKEGVFATLIMTEGDQDKELALYLESAENNTLRFKTQVPFTLENGVVTTFNVKERFADTLSLVTTENGIGVSEKTSVVKELVADNTFKGQVASTSVSLDKVDKEHIKAVVKVRYDEILRELSFEGATLDAFIDLIHVDGTVSTVKKPLDFEKLKDENTAVFSSVIDISADVTEIHLTPTESITPLGTNRLYSENRTLALSETLNDINRAKVKRVTSDTTAIIPLVDGEIQSLEDVVVVVSYPAAVNVENIEGVTLKVKAEGVKDTEEITFRAREIYGDKHLIFCAENVKNLSLANVVTLKVENAFLEYTEGSFVTAQASGMDVNHKVADISESFVIKSLADNTVPTKPSETQPTEITKATEVTETIVTTESQTTVAEDTISETIPSTEKAPTETLDDNKTEGVLTGQSRLIILVAVLMMTISATIVIVLRLKKNREE